MATSSRTRIAVALLGLSVALASPARAQWVHPMPVFNVRFDSPLKLMAEGGVLFNTMQSEGAAGPALVAGVGQAGGRAGVGYRMTAMMGAQLMANAFYLRTWRDPLGVPPRQGYVGGDVRVGMMFTSVGVGAIVRVSGVRGAPVRLTASVGIGL